MPARWSVVNSRSMCGRRASTAGSVDFIRSRYTRKGCWALITLPFAFFRFRSATM